MNLERIQILNAKSAHNLGPVIYWMSRDQRAVDNWALLFARELADRHGVSLKVVFNLRENFRQATASHYWFMMEGLKETERVLRRLRIPMIMIRGKAEQGARQIIKQFNPASIVVDSSPLKEEKSWREKLAQLSRTAVYQVDAHNIVPVWIASNQQEYSAKTFRPKINKLLNSYLETYPRLSPQKKKLTEPRVNWPKYEKPNYSFKPGSKAGYEQLFTFIDDKLDEYREKRNQPVNDVLSNLSPYLHFGQISAQVVATQVMASGKNQSQIDTYIEELVVRRELAENYCWYNLNYDNPNGFPEWARKTLAAHVQDFRPYIYSLIQLERAQTHDPLWNAAQTQLVKLGKMHGYLRMYWAKKILEWATNPAKAQKYAIALNDQYELDGRDASGYTGIAWAIGGVHDRPWPERPIFGKIRSMTYKSTSKKFDTQKFVQQVAKM